MYCWLPDCSYAVNTTISLYKANWILLTSDPLKVRWWVVSQKPKFWLSQFCFLTCACHLILCQSFLGKWVLLLFIEGVSVISPKAEGGGTDAPGPGRACHCTLEEIMGLWLRSETEPGIHALFRLKLKKILVSKVHRLRRFWFTRRGTDPKNPVLLPVSPCAGRGLYPPPPPPHLGPSPGLTTRSWLSPGSEHQCWERLGRRLADSAGNCNEPSVAVKQCKTVKMGDNVFVG